MDPGTPVCRDSGRATSSQPGDRTSRRPVRRRCRADCGRPGAGPHDKGGSSHPLDEVETRALQDARRAVETRRAIRTELRDRVVPKNRVACERRDEVLWIEYLIRFGAEPEHERVFVLGGIVA